MFFKLPVILRLDALVSAMSLFRKSPPDETCLQTRLKTANLKARRLRQRARTVGGEGD
jgi:hypothetical protein